MLIDQEYQDKILACLLKDRDFCLVAVRHLKPEYFEGTIQHNIGKMAIDFFKRYEIALTPMGFTGYMKVLIKDKKADMEDVGAYISEFKRLREISTSDSRYVLEELVSFLKNREIKKLIEDSIAKLLPKNDFQSIEKRMAGIARITTEIEKEPYDYLETIEERTKRRTEESKIKRVGISTGIRRMDEALHKNGWFPKELYAIIAPPKKGKCVKTDTLCFTEDGLVEIGAYIPKELSVDQFTPKEIQILGVNGMEDTSHVYNSGITPTKKIITNLGLELEGTWHHPVLVMQKGQHVWKEMQDLKVNDWLVVKTGQQIWGKHEMTEDMAMSMSKAANKEIPKAILQSPKQYVKSFLSTLLSIEGSVIKSNKSTVHFEITMASKKIIQQTQMLLLNCGIISKVTLKKSCATNGTKIVRDYWKLKISGQNLVKFKNEIGLYHSEKHNLLPDVFSPSTVRDWIPESTGLMKGIINEIRSADWTIRRLFNKSEHYSINRFINPPDGEVRRLTIKFAKRIIDRLDKAGIYGEASDQLRYIVSGGFAYTQINSISDSEAHTVDFTIPGTHSFVSNGLISHNSQSLIWFSNCAALQGFNAVHFTCEVSKEVVSDRLDAMNSNVQIKQLPERIQEVSEKVKSIETKSKLMIYEYPTKHLTVSEIERQVRKLKIEQDIQAHLIVVDYADLLKPSSRYNDKWEEQEGVFEELRALATKMNLPVITASQVNRVGSKKHVISGEDIAGSWGKIMVADEIITLSASKEEMAENKLRIHFSESRNSPSTTFKISTAYNFGRFYTEYLGDE